jgi:hypothetical protein
MNNFSNLILRFNNDILQDIILDKVELNIQLSDIKNLAQSESSFSVPFNIPYTPKAVSILGSLFNINNATTITHNHIDAQLIQNNHVIINGYVYVDHVDTNYIYAIIATGELTIFEDVEGLVLNNLNLTGLTYQYQNKSLIDYYVDNNNFIFSADTATHHFVNIDWFSKGLNINNYKGTKINSLLSTRKLSPVVRVKTIFDAILSSQGYIYSGSSAFISKLNTMYMSTDVPIENYTTNATSVIRCYGNINTELNGNIYLNPIEDGGNSESFNIISTHYNYSPNSNNLGLRAIYPFVNVGDSYIFNSQINAHTSGASGNLKLYLHRATYFDNIVDADPTNSNEILIGEFKVTGSTDSLYYNQKIVVPDDTMIAGTFINTNKVKRVDKFTKINYGGDSPCNVTCNGYTHAMAWNTNAILSVDDFVIIFNGAFGNTTLHSNGDGTFTITANVAGTDFIGASAFAGTGNNVVTTTPNYDGTGTVAWYGYYIRVEKDSNIFFNFSFYSYNQITITNPWLYDTGHTYTFNDLLSNSYKQYDFLNDILTEYNIYITADKTNKKFLNFKTYDDFKTNNTLDWSKKFSLEGLEVYDLQQQLYEQYTLSNAEGSDLINTSYKNTYNKTLNQQNIYNVVDLNIKSTNNIQLTVPENILTTNLLKTNGQNLPISSLYSTENSKVTFGFINKFSYGEDILLTSYQLNSDLLNDIYGYMPILYNLSNYLTFSPFQLTGSTINDISSPNTFALQFNTQDQYIDKYSGVTITNNNLYSQFWQEEMETKLYGQQKFVKAKMKLLPQDIDIQNFRKRIWISNDKLGATYYRLEKIVYPSDPTILSDVEFITDINYPSVIPTTIALNKLTYNPINQISNSSGSGGGSSGGGGTVATIAYSGSSSISVSLGYTISAIFGTGSTVIACGSHLHTGVYLPIAGCAVDSAKLGNQLPAYYAPIDSPNFTTCIKSPIVCSTGVVKGTIITGSTSVCAPVVIASTCVLSPLVCATTKVCTPFLAATTCACSPIVNGTTCSTSPIACATSCSVTPLLCATNITLTCNEGTAAFTSGFAGSGWQLSNPSGEATLTVDNIYVRKNMTVYELDINKINSINGGLMVSAANGTVYCVSGNNIYFDEDNGSKPFQFQTNDWVRAQVWTGRGICSYIGKVTGTTHNATLGSAYASMSSTCTGWKNMELVQAGNTTCAARQNLIYMTSTDSGAPYIDMLAGVTGCTFSGKQKLRIGSLSGISDASFGGTLSGYGLYANNVYLKGQIVIAANSSGYANMCDKPTTLDAIQSGCGTKLAGIAAGATNVTNTNQLTDGANLGGTAAWGGISAVPSFLGGVGAAGLYMSSTCMGFYNGSAWQSYIDCNGTAKFVGVTEFGTATACYGTYSGGLALKGADIYENGYNGQSYIFLNRNGYNGGTTQYRGLVIGNGIGGEYMDFYRETSINKDCISIGNSGSDTCTDFRIHGRLMVHGSSAFYDTLTASNTITATNFILSSDKRQKMNIQSLSISAVNIDYKQFNLCNEKEQLRFGVIAQDLQKTNPELVRVDSEGMLSVAYIDLFIKEISALKCEVKDLKRDINYYKNYNC